VRIGHVRQCLEVVVGGRNCVIMVQHTLEMWLEEGCREAVKPDEGLDDKWNGRAGG